jgi:wyosine [tRNA(Phe)-imidazoG37] synthetase (radical SAM superfamily)
MKKTTLINKLDYFYGPVPSRRLGFSLGVDLTPIKTCNFDCVYCQVGPTTKKINRRFSLIDLAQFKRRLKFILTKNPQIDYITFSGSGEPTLHRQLDKIIAAIKQVSGNRHKICLITNSSLLTSSAVRKEISKVDLIIPSLDAACEKTFKKIDRPFPGISLKKIISGLVKLRREFKGKIWLEIMLVKGINDTILEARKFKKIIPLLKPDKIELNLPVRPSWEKAQVPDQQRVEEIAVIIGGNIEVVGDFKRRRVIRLDDVQTSAIIDFLQRRPARLDNLAAGLGIKREILEQIIRRLTMNGDIRPVFQPDGRYYQVK